MAQLGFGICSALSLHGSLPAESFFLGTEGIIVRGATVIRHVSLTTSFKVWGATGILNDLTIAVYMTWFVSDILFSVLLFHPKVRYTRHNS